MFQVNTLTSHYNEIRKLQDAIDKYERSGGAEKLDASKQKIIRLSTEKDFLFEQKQEMLDQVSKVKVQLTNQQVIELIFHFGA